MGHWWEWTPMAKRMEQIKSAYPEFRFEARGETLTVFDERGCLTVMRDVDAGFDFVRTVEAVSHIWMKVVGDV